MYHVFEHRDKVIGGLPDMDMAANKWNEDIVPVIEASRYREYLPASGPGSRGGTPDTVRFTNGASLKFMTGGGGDKSRAGYTAPVLIVTETDGIAVNSPGSMEADKLTQMEARLRAFKRFGTDRTYLECTLSTAEGRTHTEIVAGTESRIALPCPHCREWVSPERDHLVGWQEAENVMEARERAHFVCPACETPWSEDDRYRANLGALLLHRGQTVDDSGSVVGDPPPTNTLGFRFSAVHNMFVGVADLGEDEWTAARAEDEDNAEREMCQFVWAVPYTPPIIDVAPLNQQTLARRVHKQPKGIIPEGCAVVTAHLDLGKYLCHYAVCAFDQQTARGYVVDYDVIEVPSDRFEVEQALMIAMQEFHDLVSAGWGMEGGGTRTPNVVWIDAGWKIDAVYAFCRKHRGRFQPAVGRAEKQQYTKRYDRPKSTGAIVKRIGDGYHLSLVRAARLLLVEVNADQWKLSVHERLSCPVDARGSLTLYMATANQHTKIAKHVTAEKIVEEFDPKKGTVRRWEKIRKNNHLFDNLYNCLAAAHFAGIRVAEIGGVAVQRTRRRAARQGLRTPDGRPFVATER